MRHPSFLWALTGINLALLSVLLALQLRPAQAETEAPVLRGRALEIVDAQGRVRASLNVFPATASADGAPASAETVLFRLITERGRPSVKLGASEPTSGLSFAGPTGTSNTWVVLEASGNNSRLEMRSEEGRVLRLRPAEGLDLRSR